MSNYQDGGAPYESTSTSPAGPYPGGGATPQTMPQGETHQFPPQSQQWQGQPAYQDHQSQGGYQNQNHGGLRRSINVRSTFKTTEFWVMVVVAVALLIAAAVTDQGDDNQGFGAQDAWRYVTALAIAYILSRGLTKFGGHEHDDHGH